MPLLKLNFLGQPQRAFDRWAQASQAEDHWYNQANHGKRLYVGGLPRVHSSVALEAEVIRIFEGFNVLAVSRQHPPRPSRENIPGNHHYVFVDLDSRDEADRAVEEMRGRQTPWGGPLKVYPAKWGRNSRIMMNEQSLLQWD